MNEGLSLGWVYDVEVEHLDGRVESARATNVVLDTGIADLATCFFVDKAMPPDLYLALIRETFTGYSNAATSTPTIVAHEFAGYSGERPVWTPSWVKPKLTNTSNKAVVLFTEPAVIGGIGLVSDGSKVSEQGPFYSVGAFGNPLRISSGARANITATLTLVSA